ncbi:MAG: hypothetical protein OEU26_02280 [Candidatus Tectomicrobia bacterium]|nr:hypothetical protein [Candidatus Tectomicrobia bacterium]
MLRRLAFLAFLAAYSLGGIGQAHAQAQFDVSVGDIHITQGVQDITQIFWTELVAQRNTAVRVQVNRVTGIPGPITGKLHVFVDGQEITPSGGLDALNNGFVPPPNTALFQLLQTEQDTLNFELLADDVPLLLNPNVDVSQNVDFMVEIFGDNDVSNNTGQVNDLTLVRRYSPTVIHFRLLWDANSATLNNQYGEPQPMDDRMLQAVWPIPDNYVQPPVPNFVPPELDPSYSPYHLRAHILTDCNGDGLITYTGNRNNDPKCQYNNVEVTEYELILNRLLQWRHGIVQAGFGPDDYTYVFGWVADGGLTGHDGLALQQLDSNGDGFGVVSYGIDHPERGQQVLAHEFGHMIGLDHNIPGRALNGTGWDVGARLHQHPLPMQDGGRVKQAGGIYGDIMNASGLETTVNTWIDLQNYQAVLDSPRLSPAYRRLRCGEINPKDTETIVVYGLPGQADKQTVIDVQAFTYPWCTEPDVAPEQPNLIVTIEVQEPSGKHAIHAAPVNARMLLPGFEEKGKGLTLAPFATPLPVQKGTQLLAVTVESLEDAFSPVKVIPSDHEPQVTILSPTPGATLAAETVISWQAKGDDRLSSQVLYSVDQGKSFIPLAVSPNGTKFTIHTRDLPTTESGQGLIRVLVNDGLNTTYQDVGRLSIRR